LDVGSGPGRLTVALAERGVPVLGIDITPGAVELTRTIGGMALRRDVFGRVPGGGRWLNALLADGNIGIGGDPVALLRRVADLLCPGGHAVIEVEPPGVRSRVDRVRLRGAGRIGEWFRWAHVSIDDAAVLGAVCRLTLVRHWQDSGRWFLTLRA
jgi:SAM-dependent methyltransferase